MPIQTVCSRCSVKVHVKDDLIGKAIKCPKCGERLAVAGDRGGTAVITSAVRGAPPSDPVGRTEELASAAAPQPAPAPAADVTGALEPDSSAAEPAVAPVAAPSATEFISQPDADAAATQALEGAPETGSTRAVAEAPLPQAHGAGQSLGGYRILRELGQGGMGAVYEAEDSKLKRHVALKVMKPEIAKNPRHRERFLREARTAAKVKSDFICPIYRVGEDDDVPFIAMPFLKGEPLDAHLKRGVRLPIEEVVRIGKQVAQGLSAAHEAGLVHRDIKPANIWLETQRSGPPRAIILDFGLARMQADDVQITQSGAIIGTPAFMSPEQARGNKNVDARTDLFSLGCVLYVLCTGVLPFQSDTTMGMLMALATHEPTPPHQLAPATPRPLSRLILRLLAKRPADRPQTAGEVLAEFVEIEAGPADPAAGAFTTQTTALEPPDTTSELQPSAADETATRKRPRRAATRARMRTASYVLMSLVGLAVFGCVAPLAAFGVYYLVFAGGQGAEAEVVAPPKKAPPVPTGEVPAGWVVVRSPQANYSVAMPQPPMTRSAQGILTSTAQLPDGLMLTTIARPMPGAPGGGPAAALDQLMLSMLLNSGALQPGGKVPETTKLELGPWPGRECRLPVRGGFNAGGYLGLITETDGANAGAKVRSVSPNSPAEWAGLKANDVVYEAAGRPITDHQVFHNTIQARRTGEEILLKVRRGEEKLELKARLGVLPRADQYVRAYVIGKHLVMLTGPAQGDGPAPDTVAFFNSLKLGGAAPDAQAEAKLPVHEVGPGLQLQGKLDGNNPDQVYRVQLAAGTTYVIDMVSPNAQALDPYLVLTDAAGQHLAEDDDGGGNFNARIVFRAEQAGIFRIVATSFNNGTGAYTLTVRAQGDSPKREKQ